MGHLIPRLILYSSDDDEISENVIKSLLGYLLACIHIWRTCSFVQRYWRWKPFRESVLGGRDGRFCDVTQPRRFL